MLYPWEEWYPSHGAAASPSADWQHRQMGAGGVMSYLSAGLGFSHHAGSPADSPVVSDSEALLFKLERAFGVSALD